MGEHVDIRDEEGKPILHYRGFATIVGLVAAFMATVVMIAGAAAVCFLIIEGRPFPAVASFLLSAGFALVIPFLVPPVTVTLFNDETPVLTIAQTSRVTFPSAAYAIVTADGKTLANVRRSFLSRLGRNRWQILDPVTDASTGEAVEESFRRSLVRKIGGKFRRSLEANVLLRDHGAEAGVIHRRPDTAHKYDVLEIHEASGIDRRVAVALATLVLGAEP